MKYLFIILFLSTFNLQFILAQNNIHKMISDVQIRNSWIIVFDSNGKIISQMPQSKKEIAGITGNFFVVTNNGWIVTYDEKCKMISQMPQSSKQVKGAAGETFTVWNNGWIVTFDKNCKEKSRRTTGK